MNTSNIDTHSTPVAASPATAASTIGGMASSLPGDALDKRTRDRMGSRSARCPDELIQLVCQLVMQSGGSVLGMTYDVQAAKGALTQVGDLQTQLAVARQLVKRLEDEVVQTRNNVADPTFAFYTALRRLVKTAKGNSLLPAFEQMQQAVKNRPRRTRSPKKPKLPGVRALKKAAKAAAASAASTGHLASPPVGGALPKV